MEIKSEQTLQKPRKPRAKKVVEQSPASDSLKPAAIPTQPLQPAVAVPEVALPSEAKIPKYGDRNAVWQGTALQTKGGLKKSDLLISARGKIVSKKQQANGFKFQERLREKYAANSVSETQK